MYKANVVRNETFYFNSFSSGKFEAIPDDLTPEEILEQAQRAAQVAAERLTLKRPNTNVCVQLKSLTWFSLICWACGFTPPYLHDIVLG
jgi:hypothetical protein